MLRCLKDGGDRDFAAAYFEAWFLQAAGFLPDFSRCRKCRRALGAGWLGPKRDGAYCPDCAPLQKDEVPAETQPFLRWVRKNPPSRLCAPPFSPEEVARLRKTLQAMIIYHMEREPRSLPFLKLG